MNVKSILCPVDFSLSSDAALKYASSLAKESGAEMHIVYVYEETIAYTEGLGSYLPPADFEPEKARLEELRPTTEVPCRHQFLVGHPADALVDYARDNSIDLIVMGTHGRTGLSRLLMGSVAEAVVRRAPCPVLTIKQPMEE
jgi:universal stress protein A